MKMRIFSFFLFTFSFFLFITCSDDPVAPVTTGTVAGQVLDSQSGTPIANASITTTPATNAITSDSSGSFTIPNVEESKFTVSASKAGYRKGIVNVNVQAGDTAQAIIQLNREEDTNTPPTTPHNPTPADGTVDQAVSLTLKWSSEETDPGDTLTYDVYLYPGNNSPQQIVSGGTEDSVVATDLKYGTTYYWQVVAKDNNDGVTHGKVWSFKTVSFPDNPMVYARSVDGNYDIYSANVDTLDSRVVRLTEESSRDWYPRLNPARDKIAFVSDRTVEPHIYTMNTDGSNIVKVTQIPVTGYYNYGIGFCWSPNGTRFLYSNYEKLYRIDANGTGLTQIATAPENRHFREVDWSPLGDKIVALTIGSWFYDSEIYVMDANGSNMALLIDNWDGAIESPSFSPDGKQIVFSHDVSGHEVSSGRQLDAHVIIADVDTGDTTDVSQNKPAGTNDTNPRFSPDGSKIIFCNAPNNDPQAKSIWIMDVNGENRKKIVSHGTMPDWR